MANVPPLIQHIESHLGTIDSGWSLRDSSGVIQVARFRNQPVEGQDTYVTLGPSHHILSMENGREVRQELVFCAHEGNTDDIVSLLLTFGTTVATKHQALLRGEVVGPYTPFISGTTLNALYAAIPVIFQDSFATFEGSSPPTLFVWVIPLHASEAAFVRSKGWNAFEDLLETKDPDLLDLHRDALV